MGDSVDQRENIDNPMNLLRRMHRWRMAFFGMVILLAGMLAGAAITLVSVGGAGRPARIPRGPEAAVVSMLDELGPRLRLSPEQRRQINPILQKHMARLNDIRDKGRAQIAEELRLMSDEVSTVLTGEQRRVWDGFLQDLPGPFRRGFGPRRLGPGPEGRPGYRRGRPAGPRETPEQAPLSPPPLDTPPSQ